MYIYIHIPATLNTEAGMKGQSTLTVGQAARELGWDYNRTLRAVYAGLLEAEMVNGRWKVASASVSRAKARSSRQSRAAEDSRVRGGGHSDD